MSEHKKFSPWLTSGIFLCVLISLLGAYVGTYYATVDWDRNSPDLKPFYGALHRTPTQVDFTEWRASEERWKTFFAPIHWIDKRLRPNIWDVEHPEFGSGW